MRVRVWDRQLEKYAFDEKVFLNKEEAIGQLLSFFSADHDRQELEQVKKDLEDNEEFAELVIEPIEDKVVKVYSWDVFDDDNDGLQYGVEWDVGNDEWHCEWYETEEEQERAYENTLKQVA